MELDTQNLYRFCTAQPWAATLTDEQIIDLIKETPFALEQRDLGRDYCYFINKDYYSDDRFSADYALMAYTLSQPENLERASINDMVLEENELFEIHRINVLRDGVLIDKIPDTKIKVLDNETNSHGGILSSSKKLNISIKDLRLNDVLILEDCRIKTFAEKEFLRKDFVKHVFISPDNYWAYGQYNYRFINNRNRKVAYKECFFRDENGTILPKDIGYLEKGENYSISYKDYINQVDTSRELYPFIDFATDATWKELSNYIYPLYKDVIEEARLQTFAPDLAETLNTLPNLDAKIRYAIEFVQNNIYYIFTADEMNGHKPQSPAITYQNKQGDCKAKSVLLKVILDYLQVDAQIVLVNYNADFYIKYYLSSLLSFNHVIVKINYKETEYFIDVTARNEFGLLENRSVLSFCFYLPVNENQELQMRKPTTWNNYAVDEEIKLKATGAQGDFSIKSTYRFNRANGMRNYFKNTNKREILDSWNNAMFYTLNYCNDRNGKDFRDIFKNAAIEIVNDDKDANEFTVKYTATIEQPYFIDQSNKRFLMYFDRNVLKNNLRDFQHSDASYWHNFDSERYDILLETDQKIDTQERFTIQECDINNSFFKHKTKKTITKNSGRVQITYDPVSNKEILLSELEEIKQAYHKVADSNFGIGIDIIEPGFMNFLKSKFKSR